MKIHADKIENGPPHNLSVCDVRLIFDSVPRHWTGEVKEVRISNSLECQSLAVFRRYDGCLTIYSRKATKKQALLAVLSELAANSIGLNTGWRRRPKAMQQRLVATITPFMQTLLPLLDLHPWYQGNVNLEGFHEFHFGPVLSEPE